MYFTVYQITNTLNGKFYIGIHATENLNDNYMGSGVALRKAYKKYGKDNFKKKILYIYDRFELMIEKEKEIVNESFIKRKDVYNVMVGGEGWNTKDLITVKDESNNTFMVHKDDKRYLNGELVGVRKGTVTVKDDSGEIKTVSTTDKRFTNGELIAINKGLVTVKDKNGNYFKVSTDDPRYIKGELKHFFKGRNLSKEHKKKNRKG